MKSKFFESFLFKVLWVFFLLVGIKSLSAQNVGINTDGSAPDNSAMLDIKANDRGLLIPRVSLTNVTVAAPVTTPATGLLVFNTNPAVVGGNGTGFYYWTGTQWSRLDNSNSADWRLTGNSGTNPANNFIGTTDNQPLVFRTNNTEQMRLSTDGHLGIGISGSNPHPLRVAKNVTGNYHTAGFTNATGQGVFVGSVNNASTWGSVHAYDAAANQPLPLVLNHAGGNVGVGVNPPTERLHVAGNLRLDNAFMPGNNAGTVGSLLRSAGAGNPPVWIAPGANGSVLTMSGGLPTWSSPNGLFWGLTGNSGTNPATNFLGTTDANDLVIRTNNAERVRVTSAGRVGIGTATPNYSLDVAGGNNTYIGVSANFPADGNQGLSGYVWRNSSDGSRFIAYLADPDGGFGVNPRSWELWEYPSVLGPGTCCRPRLRVISSHNQANPGEVIIDQAGRLGINTAPTERLHVAGNLRLDNAFMPGNNAGTAGSLLRSAGAGNAPVWLAPGANGSVLTMVGGLPTWSSPNGLFWGLTGNSGTNPATNFLGTTDANDLVIRTNNTERARVTSGGNVGIGTASPNQRLRVSGGNIWLDGNQELGWDWTNSDRASIRFVSTGDASGQSRLILETYDNNDEPIEFRQNGNVRMIISNVGPGHVGIGTTNPAARLTVVGDGTGTALIGGGFCGGNYTGISLNGQIGSCGVYNFLSSPTDQNLYINRPSGLNVFFRENNVTQMTIAAGGNVGIGITTPYTPLTIAHEASYTFPNPGSGATGALNIRMTTNNRQTGITFSQANTNNAQAGIYVHQDNTNGTHMYLATTNSYATGPQTRVAILNDGRVGIGTIAPAHRLDVMGQTRTQSAVIVTAQNNSEGGQLVLAGVADFTATSENCNSWSADVVSHTSGSRFRIFRGSAGCSTPNNLEIFNVLFNGNVGIMDVNPQERFQIGNIWTFHDGGWKVITYNGRYDAPANVWRYMANAQSASFNFTSGGDMLFRTAPSGTAGNPITYSDRMMITNAGNVGIDITNPQARLDVRKTAGHGPGNGNSNDAPTTAIITGGATARFNDWPNGWGGGLSTWDICGSSIYMSGYVTRSDSRFKKDVSILNGSQLVNLFMQLRPVSYYIKQEHLPVDDPERMRYGFLADEVEKIFPNMVVNAGTPETVARGLEYDAFIPVLVSVVQHQQKEIEALKKKLEELTR